MREDKGEKQQWKIGRIRGDSIHFSSGSVDDQMIPHGHQQRMSLECEIQPRHLGCWLKNKRKWRKGAAMLQVGPKGQQIDRT